MSKGQGHKLKLKVAGRKLTTAEKESEIRINSFENMEKQSRIKTVGKARCKVASSTSSEVFFSVVL